MKELKIVIADDSEAIRQLLQQELAKIDGCVLAGVASDGREAIDMVSKLEPDIVILDISMPHRNGIQVLREIREADPSRVIIMFTGDPSVVLKEVCLEMGANFYLDKSQVDDLMDICRQHLNC